MSKEKSYNRVNIKPIWWAVMCCCLKTNAILLYLIPNDSHTPVFFNKEYVGNF